MCFRAGFQHKLHNMMYALQLVLTVCFILFGVPDVWGLLTEDITDHTRQLITEEDAKSTFK